MPKPTLARIVKGPLSGTTVAIVKKIPETGRVVVQARLFGRAVSVEVTAESLVDLSLKSKR